MKLKEFKVTIEKQVLFATDNNFELFEEVRQLNIQNQQLSAVNISLIEEKSLILHENLKNS